MPSPFPGMDPYLEGYLWPSIHSQLSPEIARQLAPKLSPKYLALTTETFYYGDPDNVVVAARRTLSPDVGVTPTGVPSLPSSAAAIAPPPLRMETVMPAAVPHVNVEIRDRASRELVAAIELLSPTNKRGAGRRKYLAKRRRILQSDVHLLEIDLLRLGRRVPMLRALPEVPYFVFLSRAEQRPVTEVWPLRLQDRLPVVPLPLLPGDPDVPLDLSLALTNVYDLCHYGLAVDYAAPPEVTLTAEETSRVEQLLHPFRTNGQGQQ